MVRRIYVRKKEGFDIEAKAVCADLKNSLGIEGLECVWIVNRYDIEGMSDEEYKLARGIVFSEPPVDDCFDESIWIPTDAHSFIVEYLPGQYDQRADSAAQCVQILTCKDRPRVKSAKVVVLFGEILADEFEKIKQYIINPVEAHEAKADKPETLEDVVAIPSDIETIVGFIGMDADGLENLRKELGLAMDGEDIAFCQGYFRDTEKRDPTITEIRMIDTYWSDHCRHTTFLTRLDDVSFEDGIGSDTIKGAFNQYMQSRELVYGKREKPVCLMDIATIAAKRLKKEGILQGLDESEEINACSIEVDAVVDGKVEKWLVMFKNETHNHPTEIEPFGGAATCLGGAIRDPLSGRVYVYQAMRVTGSADPRAGVEDTLSGKLPQRKISTGAASGYSSYGNQIGLSTGQVCEIYHPGYVAKRLEIGAVIGAAPKENVRRERPEAGDIIVLLGGRTGRDGCGGATGSSKAHTEESIASCGAEVQKGNPPEERKMQRLFRNPKATCLIKRCNDFGAGGVSVAVGELADGLNINLDLVTKKYDGLDGTELAISESQERMAVVVAREDAEKFISLASDENLEANIIAVVTAEPRLAMTWRGNKIVDLSREFLNSNGSPKTAKAVVNGVFGNWEQNKEIKGFKEELTTVISDLKNCAQKGLVERFDASIGAGSVLMPFGGKTQLTPTDAMAAKLPVLHGETDTVTIMSYGFNPYLSSWSPFHGAVYAVVEAVCRLVATGGDYKKAYLTLQEYFERLYARPERWGKPLAALLGAFHAQMKFGIAAIGGKDSMSGSFNELDVPPTLTAFAVCAANANDVLSPEFKKIGSKIAFVPAKLTEDLLPNFDDLTKKLDIINNLAKAGKLLSASSVKSDGIAPTVARMCLGNNIGADLYVSDGLFKSQYGAFVLEVEDSEILEGLEHVVIGTTTGEPCISCNGERVDIGLIADKWLSTLEGIFPTKANTGYTKIPKKPSYKADITIKPKGIVKPKVFIPVFPGSNCEYDTARQFEKVGAEADVFVIKNLTSTGIELSLSDMAKRINSAQIVMLPGGFSGGDEPDGSGKFIAAAFRNPYVKDAVHDLLKQRDGLMLGICNGFQALIKLGLVPFGEIVDLDDDAPTLTFNTLGRHVSCMVNTRIASNKSPWLYGTSVNDVHTIAVSHGEGRFVCNAELFEKLSKNGQIATQYADFNENPTYDPAFNPNGSFEAVEGITSPDGRVFGKMGHSERYTPHTFKNIIGNKDQKIFASGVAYFR